MNDKQSINRYMQAALEQAQKACDSGEVPIGAVIVSNNEIIAKAYNTCETDKSPLQHAELKALHQAAQSKNNWRLNDCDLYVTLEPCPMCLGALFQARIQNLFIGCFDHKRAASPHFPSLKGQAKLTDNNHNLEIHSGILESECSQILKDFFKSRR